MTDWSGVDGPELPADMRAADPHDEDGYCRWCGNGRWKDHAPNCAWADARDPGLRYGVDYTLGERTGPYPLAGLRQVDAAQACGAVRVRGGNASEYLTCELWPEHQGNHRDGIYAWTEEETEMPRDPYEKGGYTGGGSAAEMRPPARVPSAAHRPDSWRLHRSFPDNEVYLRTGPTVGRVENYSYGNGHLSAQLIIGGIEYLLALQVEEPGS